VLVSAGSTTVVWRDLPFCGGQYQHQVGARGDRTNLLHVCVLPLQSAAHLPKWSHNSEIRPWISAIFFANGMIRSSHGKWWFDGWSIQVHISFSSLCVKQSVISCKCCLFFHQKKVSKFQSSCSNGTHPLRFNKQVWALFKPVLAGSGYWAGPGCRLCFWESGPEDQNFAETRFWARPWNCLLWKPKPGPGCCTF
jgi:hypothetical protein